MVNAPVEKELRPAMQDGQRVEGVWEEAIYLEDWMCPRCGHGKRGPHWPDES
jgi:hypothetical protein